MARRDKLWSFCTLLSSRGDEPDDMRRQIMVILHTFLPFRHNRVWWHIETNYGHSAPFCHQEAVSPMTCRDKLWSFRTPFRHSDTIMSDGTQRQIMVILHLVSTERNNLAVSGWCWSFGADHFQDFCRYRWRGDWPAEWCSARTKLVSYLYFPFISNKRQVKRGNCHTLISSGDHQFVGVRPLLDHFEVLDTHC